MPYPSTRSRRVMALLAGPIAVVAAGAMVMQGSYAAFSAQTRSAGNNWNTGAVDLTNDSKGTAAFQVLNMAPGQTGTKCITVTSTANVPGNVKFYFINPEPAPSSKGLDEYLHMTVEQGDGGSFENCKGFKPTGTIFKDSLYTGATQDNTWGSAVGDWPVEGNQSGESKTYQFTWTFSDTAPQSVQNAHFGIDLEWEMQSA